jgi:NTE family protein
MKRVRVGLALGSGSARGWAHIGVLKTLHEIGVQPDVIAGCSIGALVGGAYAAGHLGELEEWLRTLRKKDVLGFFDVSLMSGGLIAGERLMNFFREYVGNAGIEALSVPFAAVATELSSGREVWLRTGSLIDAVRASISLPGIFTPVQLDGKWLVDGGLINPVPVSVCRAMDADVVIAVNLNDGLIGRHLSEGTVTSNRPADAHQVGEPLNDLTARLKTGIRNSLDTVWSQVRRSENDAPGLFDVLASSINIMQDRITRSRMAGDPPDLVITPRLEHLGLLEFYRAAEAIDEGESRTRQIAPSIIQLCARQP